MYDLFGLNQNDFIKNFANPEFYIDTIQHTNKLIADKVITDKALNKAAHALIDVQADFIKVLITSSVETVKHVINTTEKPRFNTKTKAA